MLAVAAWRVLATCPSIAGAFCPLTHAEMVKWRIFSPHFLAIHEGAFKTQSCGRLAYCPTAGISATHPVTDRENWLLGAEEKEVSGKSSLLVPLLFYIYIGNHFNWKRYYLDTVSPKNLNSVITELSPEVYIQFLHSVNPYSSKAFADFSCHSSKTQF